jgi:hypothetical protein
MIRKLILLGWIFFLYKTHSFSYKDEWDCIEKILFNEKYMKILMNMNDSHCERDVLDFKVIFSGLDQNDDDELSDKDLMDIELKDINILSSDYKLYENLDDIEKQFMQSHLKSIKREDNERNSQFDKISLKTNFSDNTYKDIVFPRQDNAFILNFGPEGPKTAKLLKDLDKYKIPEEEQDKIVKQTELKINKTIFEKSKQIHNNKSLKNNKSGYTFKESNISKEGITSLIGDFMHALLNQNKEKLEPKEEESTTSSYNDLEEEDDEEVEIVEPDAKFYVSSKFNVKPLLKLKFEHYFETKEVEKEKVFQTFYAAQTRITSAQGRLLEESDTRTKAEIISEIMEYFELLPKCLKRALQVCPIKIENVIKKCNHFYEDKKWECRNVLGEMKVTLKCHVTEEYFNNACYKKCPPGFRDAKLYCLRNKYLRRRIVKFKNQNINPQTDFLWGDTFVAQKCTNFGKFYDGVSSDYCMHKCPVGWKNSGILCKKPVRFLNQKVFVFGDEDVERK